MRAARRDAQHGLLRQPVSRRVALRRCRLSRALVSVAFAFAFAEATRTNEKKNGNKGTHSQTHQVPRPSRARRLAERCAWRADDARASLLGQQSHRRHDSGAVDRAHRANVSELGGQPAERLAAERNVGARSSAGAVCRRQRSSRVRACARLVGTVSSTHRHLRPNDGSAVPSLHVVDELCTLQSSSRPGSCESARTNKAPDNN